MIIRNSQQNTFAADLQKEFEDKMVIHLPAAFAEEAAGWEEGELREFVRRGIDKAFAYQITIENDVSRFIEYMFCYGEYFDQDENYEWVQPVLNSDDLTGTEKMDSLDRLNYIGLTYKN